MPNASASHNTYRAILILVLAIFLFDVQGALIKFLANSYPVEQIAFYRNSFGLLPHIILLLYANNFFLKKKHLVLRRWKLAVSRGVLLVGAQLCFYTALANMNLATATTLAFSGPLFITILSIPMLGHKVGWWRGIAVVLGFVGVVLVMKPTADAFSVYALLPIGAAFFYALVSLSSRFFESSDSTALISVYASFAAAALLFFIAQFTGHWASIATTSDWLWIVAMGITGGMAVFCLITAYRMAEPSSLSPFEYFGIPFSFVIGWMFFEEAPFDSLFPGVIFIVGGGLFVVWRERYLKSA